MMASYEDRKKRIVERALPLLDQPGMTIAKVAKKLKVTKWHLRKWLGVGPVVRPHKSPWAVATQKLRSGATAIPEAIMSLIDELEYSDATLYEFAETAKTDPHHLIYYLYHYDPLLLSQIMLRKPYGLQPKYEERESYKHRLPSYSTRQPIGGGYQRYKQDYLDPAERMSAYAKEQQWNRTQRKKGIFESTGDPDGSAGETRIGYSFEEPASDLPVVEKTTWKSVLPLRRARSPRSRVPADLQVAFEEELRQLCQRTDLTQLQIAEMLEEEFGVRVSQPYISVICRKLGFSRAGTRAKILTRIQELCQHFDLTYDYIAKLIQTEFGVELSSGYISAICRNHGFVRPRGRKKGISPHRAPSRYYR